MRSIGFIGAGNMGSAMANACAGLEGASVWIYDVNKAIYSQFKDCKNMYFAEDIKEIMNKCDYVVMSIKPQYYHQVVLQMKESLREKQVIVTVAPSFTLEDMSNLLGTDVMIIRTMPNTPALIGEGVTAYTYNEELITEEVLDEFKAYFESFGKLIRVDEKLMPAVVATTGSSPAYAYLFIEAMADAAVSFGMPRAMAYEMAASALKGAAEMVLQTGQHPGELKDAVTSPGGTTIKAVLAMEAAGFRNSVIKGMEACYDQVINMSK